VRLEDTRLDMEELLCSQRTIILTADQAFWTCARADWYETIALEPFYKDKVQIVNNIGIENSCLLDQPPSQIKPFVPVGVAWVLGEYLKRNLTN